MPLARQDTARFPRTFVFDAIGNINLGPVTAAIAAANTTVQVAWPLPVSLKVVKVSVAWLGATLANAPSFNIVYNTVQNLGGSLSYTQGNVAPNDNSYTGGITTANGTITTVGFPNPALTTAYPTFQQIGGTGVPTNIAVDGQPLFAADVLLNTTNFPGANATAGGQGILIPTNYDAVYPAGPYAYGVGQGIAAFANIAACFTLRATSPTTTIVGLTATLTVQPIILSQTVAGTALQSIPGQLF
jgi:hypothetical protein